MSPIEPRPATSILLLREAEEGDELEVFMLQRNPQVAFCGGALVFPGGKLEDADGHARFRQHCLGADSLDDDELRFRVAGLRELFEESGILLARRQGCEGLLDGAALAELKARWQRHIQGDARRFLELLEEESLLLAIDQLEPFAHWVTPAFLDKRFDTRFFIAAAPAGQAALHDGGEAVDSLWINPQRALEEGEAGRHSLVFVTAQNLRLLLGIDNLAQALAMARQRPRRSVQPWLEDIGGIRHLCIPEDAGYPEAVFPLRPGGGF
ncbi:hypothetical protein VV867_02185 [Pseudomonas sp. JH-2]|uniref:NUDIX hydrolase n=1 Tax=Pseudomonas sp. JH-2 TaxID=3114998 RepID=UPI002E26CD59|nr:hypothetical protein [Pseudomonas sp. JH-2]